MNARDAARSSKKPQTLTAAQLADRMGLTPRQLQDLRLRGIGPEIVQRGLSIHYESADVEEIERHEALALVEQLLADDRPLTRLRMIAEQVGLKLSPILQQVRVTAPAAEGVPSPLVSRAPGLSGPVTAAVAPGQAGAQSSRPEFALPPSPPTVVSSPTTAWYLVHTKPRQDDVALTNLERQGYACYRPQIRIERIRRGKAVPVTEPMFPRYVFIQLDSSQDGKSWAPIRSTLGVSQLVYFGSRPAKVDDGLIDHLRQQEQALPTEALFNAGDSVIIAEGPFAGIEAIYQTREAEQRALILLEFLQKPVSMQIDVGQLRKAG